MYSVFKRPTNILNKLGVLTTPFGGQTRGESFHPGIDVAAPEGTKIPAISNGTVTAVKNNPTGFGNTVTMKTPNGDIQQFAHLQKSLVRPGQKIMRGQPIAKVGKSGNVYSPSGGDPSHLDLRIVSAFGRWKNPMTYLKNFK